MDGPGASFHCRTRHGSARRHSPASDHRLCARLPIDARICRRVRRHDRNGSDFQRCQRLQDPLFAQRRHYPRMDGRHSRGLLPRRELPRAALHGRPICGTDRALPTRAPHLWRRMALLRAPVLHLRRPRARQHRLRRLSAAGQHPRQRPLHAQPARRARRSFGIL